MKRYDPKVVPKFFELQIKTLFQHAWAEANHDLAYKPPVPMSTKQKRLIAFTAAQAWGADQVLSQLYSELINMPRITVESIEQYRSALTIGNTHLKCDMWDIFDKQAFEKDARRINTSSATPCRSKQTSCPGGALTHPARRK